MKRILVSVAMALVLFSVQAAYGFSSKGQDCSKCHTLKKDEAAGLLKSIIPNAQVLDVRTSPFKSVWELDIEVNGKKAILYVDLSKKFLFSGTLFDINAKNNLTQNRMEELNRVDVSKIPLQDAIVLGSKNAKNRIIVFDDPD